MTNDYKTKTWLSPLVAATFILSAITGLMMLFHIKSFSIKVLHEGISVLFVLAGVLHLIKNWRIFTAYFKHRAALIATALALIIGALLVISHLGEQPGGHGGPHGPGGPANAFESPQK